MSNINILYPLIIQQLTSGRYGTNIALVKFPAIPDPIYTTAVRNGPKRRSKSDKNMCWKATVIAKCNMPACKHNDVNKR